MLYGLDTVGVEHKYLNNINDGLQLQHIMVLRTSDDTFEYNGTSWSINIDILYICVSTYYSGGTGL